MNNGVGVLWWVATVAMLGGRSSLCARRSLQLGFGENLRRNWFSLVCFAATLHVDTNQRSPISISRPSIAHTVETILCEALPGTDRRLV